ncbi:MAG: NAD(P)-dependent oxidoreductase [Chloroflexi bacterium]|nr:NAD(P)-dependent oxidoreductase [Chloroflexota bacterium]
MASVLVTGGSGVIGSWVTRALVDRGMRVVIYSRHPNPTLLKDILNKVDCIEGDVLDLPRILNVIKQHGVERIIHMSASLPKALDANPYMVYHVNVDGTMNILEAARLMNIRRVVYTSTKGVLAPASGEYAYPTYKPVDEDYPKAPNSIYGATKFFCENMVESYNRLFGLDVVVLRFGMVYGPEKQTRHGELGIHSKIIESAMLGQPLKIPQGRDEREDIVYTRDIAQGIVLACFAENLKHRVFHIGTGKGISYGEIAETVNRFFGKQLIEVGPGLNPMIAPWVAGFYFVMNIDRARQELGYKPQYDYAAAVQDYVAMLKLLDIKPQVLC